MPKLPFALPKIPYLIPTLAGLFLLIVAILAYFLFTSTKESNQLHDKLSKLEQTFAALSEEKKNLEIELHAVVSEDQFVKNKELQQEIKDLTTAYAEGVALYEDILELRAGGTKTTQLETLLADSFSDLAKRNYSSGSATLRTLKSEVAKTQATVAETFEIPESVPVDNAPPSGGYKRQTVETEIGRYLVDIISADLGSTRVVVDTASAGDCKTDCPVDSLGAYAARSGAFAGINGPYFCPAEYPSCADKKNSFDTLLMNKNKTYFNSDNNVYSVVPAVIFSGSGARFVGKSLEWGRDTGVDSVIAAQPMLLSGGNITFGGDGDPKKGSKGRRSFIGTNGNTVYIGVVHNATVAEVAYVLKALGLQHALNLDSGGSTALWHQGRYLAGPGRNTPFGILLVRK